MLKVTGPPKFDPSITNWTVPVGVPALDVTVAVKVTFWPRVEGLADDETAVIVGALATVKVCVTSGAGL